MFFFQIECKKNTKSFVLQMLAAHNVAIILNIWDAWIITKILSNTEVKAFLYSFTKKKKNLSQLLQKWCAKFLPVTDNKNRREGCHDILLPFFLFPA